MCVCVCVCVCLVVFLILQCCCWYHIATRLEIRSRTVKTRTDCIFNLHASPVKISSRHPAGLPSYLYKYLGNPGSSRAPSSNHFILLSFSPSLLLSSSVPSGDFALRRSHVALPGPLVGLFPYGHCLLDSTGFRCRWEDVRSGLFTFPGDLLLSFLPPESHHA